MLSLDARDMARPYDRRAWRPLVPLRRSRKDAPHSHPSPAPTGNLCSDKFPLVYGPGKLQNLTVGADDARLLFGGIPDACVRKITRFKFEEASTALQEGQFMLCAFGPKPYGQDVATFAGYKLPTVRKWTREGATAFYASLMTVRGQVIANPEDEEIEMVRHKLTHAQMVDVMEEMDESHFPDAEVLDIMAWQPNDTNVIVRRRKISSAQDGDESARIANECTISCLSALAGTGASVLICGILDVNATKMAVLVTYQPQPPEVKLDPAIFSARAARISRALASLHICHLLLNNSTTSIAAAQGQLVVWEHDERHCVYMQKVAPEWIELATVCATLASNWEDAQSQTYLIKRASTLQVLVGGLVAHESTNDLKSIQTAMHERFRRVFGDYKPAEAASASPPAQAPKPVREPPVREPPSRGAAGPSDAAIQPAPQAPPEANGGTAPPESVPETPAVPAALAPPAMAPPTMSGPKGPPPPPPPPPPLPPSGGGSMKNEALKIHLALSEKNGAEYKPMRLVAKKNDDAAEFVSGAKDWVMGSDQQTVLGAFTKTKDAVLLEQKAKDAAKENRRKKDEAMAKRVVPLQENKLIDKFSHIGGVVKNVGQLEELNAKLGTQIKTGYSFSAPDAFVELIEYMTAINREGNTDKWKVQRLLSCIEDMQRLTSSLLEVHELGLFENKSAQEKMERWVQERKAAHDAWVAAVAAKDSQKAIEAAEEEFNARNYDDEVFFEPFNTFAYELSKAPYLVNLLKLVKTIAEEVFTKFNEVDQMAEAKERLCNFITSAANTEFRETWAALVRTIGILAPNGNNDQYTFESIFTQVKTYKPTNPDFRTRATRSSKKGLMPGIAYFAAMLHGAQLNGMETAADNLKAYLLPLQDAGKLQNEELVKQLQVISDGPVKSALRAMEESVGNASLPIAEGEVKTIVNMFNMMQEAIGAQLETRNTAANNCIKKIQILLNDKTGTGVIKEPTEMLKKLLELADLLKLGAEQWAVQRETEASKAARRENAAAYAAANSEQDVGSSGINKTPEEMFARAKTREYEQKDDDDDDDSAWDDDEPSISETPPQGAASMAKGSAWLARIRMQDARTQPQIGALGDTTQPQVVSAKWIDRFCDRLHNCLFQGLGAEKALSAQLTQLALPKEPTMLDVVALLAQKKLW